MFYYLMSFVSRKYMYKAMIYSSYYEYKSYYDKLKSKYPKYHGYMTSEESKALGDEFTKDMRIASREQSRIVNEMVSMMKLYCAQYPGEKLCESPQLKSYDQYPYRLEQTLPSVIELLS